MSLTSDLRSGGRIKSLFTNELPELKEIAVEARSLLQDVKTIVPKSNFTQYDYCLVGTAFDYRARFFFERFSLEQTIAREGARLSSEVGLGVMERIFFTHISPMHSELMQRQGENPPFFSETSDRELCGLCLHLARFDEFVRALGPAIDAYEHGKVASFADLESRNRPALLDDLSSLSKNFLEKFKRHFDKTAILNPTFEGSGDVGGADADLILGNTLIDFKCTIDQKLPMDKFRQSVYQLIGYAMLDYSDEFRIKDVGIYYARQGVLWTKSVTSLLNQLSRGRLSTIDDVRASFLASKRRKPVKGELTPPP